MFHKKMFSNYFEFPKIEYLNLSANMESLHCGARGGRREGGETQFEGPFHHSKEICSRSLETINHGEVLFAKTINVS